MSILMAVNDGLVNNNWDEADVCFLVGLVLGSLAAICYAAGVGTVARPEEGPDRRDDATTTTPTGAPAAVRTDHNRVATTWHYRFHELAAALLSLAVAAVAFGLFLQ